MVGKGGRIKGRGKGEGFTVGEGRRVKNVKGGRVKGGGKREKG